jgi:hypothetical protein
MDIRQLELPSVFWNHVKLRQTILGTREIDARLSRKEHFSNLDVFANNNRYSRTRLRRLFCGKQTIIHMQAWSAHFEC